MAFDTHASVKKLQEAGFTPQQAEAQVELMLTVVEGNLATKQDIELVRHDIELVRQDTKEMESRTEVRLKEMESRTEVRLKEMETRSDHKFELVHQKIELARRDTIIWLGGMIVLATTVLGTLMKVL
ncbi:MAG: DUF1640 domain-containing protein [SAR324 cluster bacterium]|nr:DUF1640 domain-containing protein [SAR324 cluster bacterium]